MARQDLILASFNSGEWSPTLYGRTDLQKYYNACRLLENFLVKPQGGAQRRPGSYLVAETKYHTKKSRLIPFRFSTTQAYQLEVGHEYIRFYMDNGQIVVTANDVSDFDPTSSYTTAGDFIKVGDYISLDCGSSKYLYVNAPHDTDTSANTVEVEIAGSDTLAVTYTAGAIKISLANATAANNKASLIQAALRASDAAVDDWYVTENAAYAAARPTSGVTLTATALTDCDQIYYCISAVTGNADNKSLFPPIETDYWTNQTIYEIATTYQETDLSGLVYAQSADTMYIVHPSYAVYKITRTGHTSWTWTAVSFTANPFTGADDYPSCVEFFEQRLFFACTNNDPQKVWGSKSADYEDMTTGSLDDDALEYTIAASKINAIRWMVAKDVLLIGTVGAEWRMGASSASEPITPSNILCRRQSAYGSALVQPAPVGQVVLFLQAAERKVRELVYNFEQDTYLAPDMSLLAEHMTESGVIDMAYQQEPDSILWCVLRNGYWTGLTYQRDQKVVGWHRHITQGKVESVSCIPSEVTVNVDSEVDYMEYASDGAAQAAYPVVAAKEIDYIEYATDVLIQGEYVSSDGLVYGSDVTPKMTSNTAPSGIASASSTWGGGQEAYRTFDDTIGINNVWQTAEGTTTGWLQYQFGSGKTIQRYTIQDANHPSYLTRNPKDWTFLASATGAFAGEEVTLDTQTGQVFTQNEKKTFSFTNATSYTYYRINVTANNGDTNALFICEMEMMEATANLLAYSEDTIKQQGDYSLKGVAVSGDSLNDTLTRTVSPTKDLSGYDTIKFDVRANRTGENLQVLIHNNGTGCGSDFLTGGTASASGVGGGAAANGVDDDIGTAWADTDGSPYWWKYDLGAGNAKTARKLRFYRIDSTWSPKDYTWHGSNDDSAWTELVTVNDIAQAGGWIEDTFANEVAYRYYRFTIDANLGAATEGRVHEFEAMEYSYHNHTVNITTANTWQTETWDISGVADADKDAIDEIKVTIINADAENTFYIDNIYAEGDLQCYSESTLKEQGSYSLKIVAAQDKSEDGYFLRTFASVLNMTDNDKIVFSVRASRTGENFKLQIKSETTGVTTEKTINIAIADTWQTVEWDISGVATVDKEDIKYLYIVITNDTAANTIYLDDILYRDEVQTTGEDILSMIVKRNINGVIKRFIEYLMPQAFNELEDAFFVDCGLTYEGSPVTTISGLNHLVGEEVAILADGLKVAAQTVNASGEITLATAARKVHAGLAYTPKVQTMNLEAGSRTGTAQGKIKRIHEVLIRMKDSVGGKAGYDEDHLTDIGGTTLFSGDKRLTFPKGYDRDYFVMVTQPEPLPMHLIAALPHLKTEDG